MGKKIKNDLLKKFKWGKKSGWKFENYLQVSH